MSWKFLTKKIPQATKNIMMRLESFLNLDNNKELLNQADFITLDEFFDSD